MKIFVNGIHFKIQFWQFQTHIYLLLSILIWLEFQPKQFSHHAFYLMQIEN